MTLSCSKRLTNFTSTSQSFVTSAMRRYFRGILSLPPLQPQVFSQVFAIRLVELIDDFVVDAIFRHAHHEPQIEIAGRSLAVGGDSFAFDAQLLTALGAGGNRYLYRSTWRWHVDAGAAHGFADGDR